MRTMLRDAAARPECFIFSGPVPQGELEAWMRAWGVEAPDDLVAFWESFGGAEVFETETLLSPLPRTELEDDLMAENQRLHQRGLPRDYLLFHVGATLSAVRQGAPPYVTLDHVSLMPTGQFATLDEWYRRVLHDEYAEWYGIADDHGRADEVVLPVRLRRPEATTGRQSCAPSKRACREQEKR